MSHPKIGIVLACFSPSITEHLWKSCQEALREHGLSDSHWTVLRVPGALEVPLALQYLARSGQYSGLIALGAVIRGETYHFEVVSDQSAAGILQVQLNHHIPIANGILTTENEWQAAIRADTKGRDCAHTVLTMIEHLSERKTSHV